MTQRIDVVGLGPGPARLLTLETRDLLMAGNPVYLRTAVHPTVPELQAWGCTFTSFDSFYEQAPDFESLYSQIVTQLLAEAKAHGQIIYAVPGNPLVAESTVQQLLVAGPDAGIEVVLHTAVSCVDVVLEAVGVDPSHGLVILDALALEPDQLDFRKPQLITQIYSQAVASEVKLTLLERLDPDYSVTLVRAAGCVDQEITPIAVEDLDRVESIDHLTTLYLPAGGPETLTPLEYLRWVVARLRDPDGGCPWDLKQNAQTLRKYVIEEAYEVVEAIEQADPEALCEELGDLLLQVYLQSQVAQDEGDFELNEVALGIAEKLIYRHPHVFGEGHLETPEEVKKQWEDLKAQAKAEKSPDGLVSVLADLPTALPALSLAEKIGKKVTHVGFDWPEIGGVLAKIAEEYQELLEACEQDEPEAIFHELGDVLFTLVNLARWYKLDPEDALRQTNARFTRRFQAMEGFLAGRSLKDLSLEEWDSLWNRAKEQVG
jgi:tetrapyrrole methylase family protein / MazG family protein